MAHSNALERVRKGNLCSGCGGCALVAGGKVNMEIQKPGYARPKQTEPLTAAENEAVWSICPGLGQAVDRSGRNDDILWGPYLQAYRGFAADPELRFKASSGGALSALLHFLLQQGRVDGVIEVSADPDNPIGNITVMRTDREGIVASAGSRYAPSSPLADLSDYLDRDQTFAVVGKPCDIAALRALRDQRADIAQTFPVLISFFCAGVPSLEGAEQILRDLGTSLSETNSFRYRGHGWPGRATAYLNDGRSLSMTYHESWGKILSRHVQHRCKICADGSGAAADIVCADVWETDSRGYPLFEEQDGQSLIMTRTPLGQDILDGASAAGAITLDAFELNELEAIQPGQTRRRKALLARVLALRLMGAPVPLYKGLHLFAAAKQNSLAENLRNFLGMVRRRFT